MIKEFSDNVQRLFKDIVTDKTIEYTHTAEELLAVLRCKVVQPIKIMEEASRVCVIYYNVSVILADNLSEMNIAYNSEYQKTFNKISSCDLHQLSEFILALERDIPKWKHIWVADDKLKKEQAKIGERVKSAMCQFRSDWMSVETKDDVKMIEKFRIKYYNLKARKMFLENGNPIWENKATEVEILEECRALHIDPPMELWYTEFSDFVDECKQIRDERDRQREEAKRKEEKMRHLIRIKQLKFEAIIKSVEFHQGFKVEVESHLPQRHFSFFSRQAVPYMSGYFLMRFKISGASTVCRVYFNDVDRCTPAIINTISRINDMIPELCNTLVDDGQQYYLMGDNYSMGQLLNDDNPGEPFSVVQYSYKKKRAICCPQLPSNRVVMRINAAIRELIFGSWKDNAESMKEMTIENVFIHRLEILANPADFSQKITHFSAGGLGACAYNKDVTVAELVRCWEFDEFKFVCPESGETAFIYQFAGHVGSGGYWELSAYCPASGKHLHYGSKNSNPVSVHWSTLKGIADPVSRHLNTTTNKEV